MLRWAMELELHAPEAPHRRISREVLAPARAWVRTPPRLLRSVGLRPTELPVLRPETPSFARSRDVFRDALLVWSDCFVMGRRLERSFSETARFTAGALAVRDAGSLAQRTAGISVANGRLVLDDAKLASIVAVDPPVAFATAHEPHNWGLFLLHSVPAMFDHVTRRRDGEKLFVHRRHATMGEMTRLLGIAEADVIAHDVFATYRLREAVLRRPGRMDLAVTAEERAMFADLAARVPPRGATPRRLFVSRAGRSAQPDAPRVLEDEAALAAGFAALGFTAIDPGAMALADQIACFAGAEMVAGPGGAGLFNAVFCRPGTMLLSIEDSPTFLTMHANLFASLGLDYGFCLGEAVPGDGTRRWRVDQRAALAAAGEFFGIG